jgi:hypothetical protein
MFDSKQTLTERLSDAFDLMIDFATLGEYGLEPVGRTSRACEGGRERPVQESFSEALFPNSCGPRRNAARNRGGREASRAFSSTGAA